MNDEEIQEEELDVDEEVENEEIEEVEDDSDVEVIKKAAKKCRYVEDLPEVTDWCSTGATVLDLAISNRLPGGIPIGRIIHAYGGGSTAKTVLLTSILGYAQRSGKQAHFDDVEHTLDPAFAKYYGLDCSDKKSFFISHSETLEQMFDETVGGIIFPNGRDPKKKRNNTPKIIGVDSITALPSKVEIAEAMDKGSYDLTRSKQMGKGFRKYIYPLSTSNTTLFCIDQTRDKIGILFGNKETTSGGRALEFYSSVRIHLHHESNVVNSKKVVTGIWVRAEIAKNKVAPPFRKCRFKILFDYGIDDIHSNLYFLMFYQKGDKAAKGKTEKLKLFGEDHTQRDWIRIVERDNLEEQLRQEVKKLWDDIYKIEDRKAKVW
jgi:recombination protein RecA